MKRATLALLAGALLLTGCAAQSADDVYVTAVKEKTPTVLDKGTAEELVSLGHSICESLDVGSSAFDIAEGITEHGWTMGEAGTVVVQAAKVLCPEHLEKVS